MGIWFAYKKLTGWSSEGKVVGIEEQVNDFLLTVYPVEIISVTFTTENDEYGVGHGVAHVVYKISKKDNEKERLDKNARQI